MKTEYEVKILGISPKKIKEKLEDIDAVFVGDFLMRRCVYDLPKQETASWVRLRDDGQKITLAYKKRHNNSLSGIQETEVRVDSFSETKKILDNLGLKFVSYQENRREHYQLGELEISLDSWPLLEPHLEVEGPNVDSVRKGVKLLGFRMKDTTTKTKLDLYKDKGINLHGYKKLTFDVQK